MTSSIYDTLLGLPLFQGLSKSEFEEVLGKLRLDFTTVPDGCGFIKAGDKCSSFFFVLSGTVRSSRSSADGRVTLGEYLSAPALLESHSLFGIQPVFVKSYTAAGSVSIVRFDKQYLYSVLYKYNICRMNLLNILSGRIQTLENDKWRLDGGSLRDRIVRLVSGLCDIPGGAKEVTVKMDDFADILAETRLNVSRNLNALADEGKIILRRGGFDIPSLEKLTND